MAEGNEIDKQRRPVSWDCEMLGGAIATPAYVLSFLFGIKVLDAPSNLAEVTFVPVLHDAGTFQDVALHVEVRAAATQDICRLPG